MTITVRLVQPLFKVASWH